MYHLVQIAMAKTCRGIKKKKTVDILRNNKMPIINPKKGYVV